VIEGTEHQPHAAAVLGPALPPKGRPSHAYLLYGPRGSGKRTVARAFAAALLADGSSQAAAQAIAERVARGTHPDLTWVRPSGASEMLVSDLAEPVVAAASRTPFEARRRVFVIEGADVMGERPANMMLKTLEEPPEYAHLLLLADRREDVLPTIVSRCQLVRFDPLPPAAIEAQLLAEQGGAQGGSQAAAACARLALGDAELATRLAGEDGRQLRAAARALAAAALGRGEPAPWRGLLEAARSAGSQASERELEGVREEIELLPARERRRREREASEAARRTERRERTSSLDLGLRLLELRLRDVLCIAEGAPELIHGRDEQPELAADAQALSAGAQALSAGGGGGASALRRAIDLVCDTRLRLPQNVSEELALEALSHRLRAVLGG